MNTVVGIIKLPTTKVENRTLIKYLEVFLDARAGEPGTMLALKKIRDKIHSGKKRATSKYDMLFTYHEAAMLWEFMNAMLEDEVIVGAGDQMVFCNHLSTLAVQLDNFKDNKTV